VTIEDAAELQLNQRHVLRLEARPPNIEGEGAVPIRDLVRNSLRMRPDRIIVGECRGPEALDMLQAMNTGHDGSLSTVHAGSPAEALRRVETLALMAGLGLPHAALREQVADAFDLVVCQARGADGVRRVIAVAEVVRVAGGAAARELYAWRDGRGRWRPLFHFLLIGWHTAITAIVLYGAIAAGPGSYFEGAMWGVRVPLAALAVPFAVFLALAILRVRRERSHAASPARAAWGAIHWRTLGVAVLLLPVAIALFQMGDGIGWTTRLATAATIVQWILLTQALSHRGASTAL